MVQKFVVPGYDSIYEGRRNKNFFLVKDEIRSMDVSDRVVRTM